MDDFALGEFLFSVHFGYAFHSRMGMLASLCTSKGSASCRHRVCSSDYFYFSLLVTIMSHNQ